LTVSPPTRHGSIPTGFGTPDIRIQRAKVAQGGRLTLSDISDDDLSWDSELDAPDDTDSELDMPGPSGYGQEAPDAKKEDDSDSELGLEHDPWNAVCVIGVRVFSKDQGAEIEVIRGDVDDQSDLDEADDVGLLGPLHGPQRRTLDVDDASKDAVRKMPTPTSSPISPRVGKGMGSLAERLSERLGRAGTL